MPLLLLLEYLISHFTNMKENERNHGTKRFLFMLSEIFPAELYSFILKHKRKKIHD